MNLIAIAFAWFTVTALPLLWMAFVIWMLIDCIRTTGIYYWAFLILIFQPIGPIVYFAVYVLPTLGIARRWERMLTGSKRMAKLKAQAYNIDGVYQWTQLGDEYRDRGSLDKAAEAYDEALKREPKNEEASYGLGMVRLAQKRWSEALDLLNPLAGQNPACGFGDGTLAVARAWRGLGRNDEAMAAYEVLFTRYSFSDAQYEYAELLWERGDHDKAAKIMRRVAADGRNAAGFTQARDRRWGRKAALFLRIHGQSV